MLPEWILTIIAIGFLGGVFLLAWCKGKYNASKQFREWETIDYNWSNPDPRIPQWIRNYIKRIDLHTLSHKLYDEREIPYLRGKYYEWEIYAEGQSGDVVTIRRRKIA